jgi:hypothetical protein
MTKYEPISIYFAFWLTFTRIVLAVGVICLMLYFGGIKAIYSGDKGGDIGADDIVNLISLQSITYAKFPFNSSTYILYVKGNTEKVYTIKANELEILKDLTKHTSYYPTQKFTFPDWCYIVFPLIILFLPIRRREQTPEPKETK